MDGIESHPTPTPALNSNVPPPFLSKTYDMVENPSSNDVVSWTSNHNSFVVWKPAEFARDLLPKYFKHNNFSSFVRQLNTYGFRKIDPDRWEFANEGFLRGQKHLLKGISRRKPVHAHPQPQQSQTSYVGPACVEVGKFGLEEEVERLKRDKNVLMQELVRLRQQQQSTDNQLQSMVQRLQGMEQRQQQMMSFLAKAVQSPRFLAQFMQQQNESNRRIITEANKKRRLKQEDASNGQIVKYQPPMNEAAKAMLLKLLNMNETDSSQIKDGLTGVSLEEVRPFSDIVDPELWIPETVPETTNRSNVDIDNMSPDPDIDALLDGNPNFWDDILLQSLPIDTMDENVYVWENGWDKDEHMDELIEQMGQLESSANNGV